MIFTKIKTLLTILFTFFNFLNINSQTIAYAEKLNSQEYFNRIYNIRMENPAEDLYDLNWNHSHVHVYSQLDAPKSYNIRLTRFSMPLKNNIIVTSKVGYRKRFGRSIN